MIHVFMIAAVTADGFIAKSPSQVSTEWTSKEDKQFFVERTKEAGVVVMGARTFVTIGKNLPGRHIIVYSDTAMEQDGIEVTRKDPKELVADLEKRGYKEVAICGGSTIYSLFMAAGVVQTAYLTVHPIMFGGGIPLFSKILTPAKELKLTQSKQLSPDVLLLEYQIKTDGAK
ncbi:MAG: dihydrofolate reductase family protein [Candidatus Liptonbacteria bacterium]